ncbi:MAG: T9SS type A sorting domain-containing protein, partial [Bacteroidota bacterium]
KGSSQLIKSDGSSQNQIALSRVKVAGDSVGISGPIFLQDIRGSIDIDNLLMHDNYALSSGGAIYATTQHTTDLDLVNCTFTQNHSLGNGYGLYLEGANNGSLDLELTNSILWNNDNGDEISSHGNVNTSYSYSILESTVSGQSILNLDPLFLDPANQDFQLDWISPAIDVGNPLASASLTDLNNNPRVQGTGIDLGAYESPFTTSIENTTQSQLSFFPNPSQGQIFIDLSSFNTHDEVSVKLYDPLGKLVFEDCFAERSSESLAVDFGKLSAGLFLLTVQVGEQSYSQNLIIH